MDDPVAEIPRVIQTLCTAPAAIQRVAIETYFTQNASFTHPFCRTGSFAGSIWLITMIYRWYKILSPHIDVAVDSVAFDKENLLLYVSIHQNFKLWAVPFYNAPVKLVTVLQLTTDPIPQPSDPYDPSLIEQPDEEETSENGDNMGTGNKRNGRVPENSSSSAKEAGEEDIYYILSQNDLYQTSEFIKFVVPWGLGVFFVGACQIWATVLCVVGTKTFDLLVWLPRKLCSPKYVNEELDVD